MGILTVSDWWNVQSVVHPLAIGGATVAVLFTYFRCTSPRSLHPNSIFTIIVSVALGSTLSRIITQPELNFVRGLVSLFLLLFVEWLTTYLPTHVSLWFTKVFKYPPVLLAFRGQADRRMMRHHRIAPSGLLQGLREHGFHSLDQIEVVLLEGNGRMSVVPRIDRDDKNAQSKLEALMAVPGYPELCQKVLGESRGKHVLEPDLPYLPDFRSKKNQHKQEASDATVA